MTSAAAPAPLLTPETWYTQLARRPPASVDWLWRGYLARGAVTLLTSQWKSGKTTLISVLMSKMAQGGELGGENVPPARVAVASEESLDCWQRRGEKLQFGQELCFFCQPFAGRPTLEAWDALVDRLAELRRERAIDVVILDPLAAFLPGAAENQTGAMLEVLQRLSKLTRQGQAVLVLHHPTKGSPAAGQLARGCGALCAYVDILMEMSLVTSALETDRRRRIAAWSRFEETPRQRMVELSADGRDYRAILDTELEQEDCFSRHWPAVERLLAFPPRKLTRQELLTAWRAKATAPSPMTLWRVLDRAVARGLLLCQGAGTWTDPFRYWLAELPTQWETKDDPAADYWPLVQHLLTCPPRKMSQVQLLQQWPKGAGRPNPALLSSCLEHAVADGRLQQEGSGRRKDPVLYFFPNLDAKWEPDISELLGL
jgi:hypothetical protein